jgi:hypothetical protein
MLQLKRCAVQRPLRLTFSNPLARVGAGCLHVVFTQEGRLGIEFEPNEGHDAGARVKRVISDGLAAAQTSASICKGQQIVSVNGNSVLGSNFEQTMRCLRESSSLRPFTLTLHDHDLMMALPWSCACATQRMVSCCAVSSQSRYLLCVSR